jgi:hypothetical protein
VLGNQAVARVMTSGMVTTQKDEPLIFRGEMDNPQPSPKDPLGLRMLFTGQMVVGGLQVCLRYGRALGETWGVVTA